MLVRTLPPSLSSYLSLSVAISIPRCSVMASLVRCRSPVVPRGTARASAGASARMSTDALTGLSVRVRRDSRLRHVARTVRSRWQPARSARAGSLGPPEGPRPGPAAPRKARPGAGGSAPWADWRRPSDAMPWV